MVVFLWRQFPLFCLLYYCLIGLTKLCIVYSSCLITYWRILLYSIISMYWLFITDSMTLPAIIDIQCIAEPLPLLFYALFFPFGDVMEAYVYWLMTLFTPTFGSLVGWVNTVPVWNWVVTGIDYNCYGILHYSVVSRCHSLTQYHLTCVRVKYWWWRCLIIFMIVFVIDYYCYNSVYLFWRLFPFNC